MFQETWLLALCVILLILVLVGASVILYIRQRNSKQRKNHNATSKFLIMFSIPTHLPMSIKLIYYIIDAAIANAQQCLLGKEAVWLRERPTFDGSNEPRIEILNCHQSLLHG
jgi:hypothetical protein